MDDDVPSAATTITEMLRWRLSLLESAVISEIEGKPDSRLGEALDAVRKLRVDGAMAAGLLGEGYAIRRAEERSGREEAPPSRGGLQVVPSRRPPAA